RTAPPETARRVVRAVGSGWAGKGKGALVGRHVEYRGSARQRRQLAAQSDQRRHDHCDGLRALSWQRRNRCDDTAGPRSLKAGLAALALTALSVAAALTVNASASSSLATVNSTKNSVLGTILVTAQGRTLYHDASEPRNVVRCTGSCAALWLPLVVTAAA